MHTFTSLTAATLSDLQHAVHAWPIWLRMGWHDILSRYRRSWLGPVWLIVTVAVVVGSLSFVYSTIFQISALEFLPFVAIGIVVWGFISAVTTESITAFVEAETYIRTLRITLFVFVLRVFWRNVIAFLTQFAFILVLLIGLGVFSPLHLPLVFVGLVLLFAQGLWVIPLLGLFGTRFRDLQPVVQNLLQVLFFVTPVFWLPSLLGSRRWIADFNPLSRLINLVREPLLGRAPSLEDYLVVLLVTCVGGLTTLLFYGRFRSRVVYWL